MVKKIALTGTVDILRDIAAGDGPNNHLVVLGYSVGGLDSWIRR